MLFRLSAQSVTNIRDCPLGGLGNYLFYKEFVGALFQVNQGCGVPAKLGEAGRGALPCREALVASLRNVSLPEVDRTGWRAIL